MKEIPVFIKDSQLFCIVCVPEVIRSEVGVTILNAGLIPSAGPYRLNCDLARRFASAGFVSVRFDQSGKGESPSRSRLSQTEAIGLDYDEVLEVLSHFDIKTTITIGMCSGADDILRILQSRTTIIGAVLFDGFAPATAKAHLRYYIPRLIRLRSWKTLTARIAVLFRSTKDVVPATVDIRDWGDPKVMMSSYENLLDRGGKLLTVFTPSVAHYYNYQGQLEECLKTQGALKEVLLPLSQHIFPTEQQRREAIELVVTWAEDVFNRPDAS